MNGQRQNPSSQPGQSPGQNRHGSNSKERRSPSVTEWLVGGVATVLILGGIGFLAYEAWHGTSLPPLVSIEIGQILPQPQGGYVVEIVAVNRGGTTAQGLAIEGKLLDTEPSRGATRQAGDNRQGSGRAIETSSTTLSWVPAHTEREGGLFFTMDPRQYEIQVRATGYEKP